MTDEINWISLEDAAEQLGSTPLNLLMMIKRGFLVGKEVEGGWLVDAAGLTTCRENGSVINGHTCRGKSSCGGCH